MFNFGNAEFHVCVCFTLCFFSLLVKKQIFFFLSQRVSLPPCALKLTKSMFTASLIKLYRHTCVQTATYGACIHTQAWMYTHKCTPVHVNITELQQHLACISFRSGGRSGLNRSSASKLSVFSAAFH